jgi:hypothetical protein
MHAKAAGEALHRIDTLVAHGQSTKVRALVCEELGISERTGRVYLQIFSGWNLVEAAMTRQSLIPDPGQFSIRQALAIIRNAKMERANGSYPSGNANESNEEGRHFVQVLVEHSSNGARHLSHEVVKHSGANESSSLLVPDVILTPALKLVEGSFTIDGTSEPECTRVPADLHYVENALFEPWFDKLFLNLTPGMEIEKWIEKLSQHLGGSEDRVTECLLLLPVETGSKWFEQLVRLKASVHFCRDPLTFYGRSVPAPFLSLVAYVGDKHGRFAETFAPLGPVLRSTRSFE